MSNRVKFFARLKGFTPSDDWNDNMQIAQKLADTIKREFPDVEVDTSVGDVLGDIIVSVPEGVEGEELVEKIAEKCHCTIFSNPSFDYFGKGIGVFGPPKA